MFERYPKFQRLLKRSIAFLMILNLAGCYFVDYFKDNNTHEVDVSPTAQGVVIGKSLGDRAYGIDESALDAVHAITSTHSPALIRPDPDLYARRLLLQYRQEGQTVARLVGEVEAYTDLLGGANEDFSKKPQTEYDATSLLATLQVSEVVCEGLVDPDSFTHPGWQTILPADPSDHDTNIKFLAQRFTGVQTSKIPVDTITSLKAILDSKASGEAYELEDYVSVCAVLAIDAESLYL